MRFDLLSEYTIPYLHPLAVHFPLVLLLIGAAAGAFYLALGAPLARQAALVFLVAGAGAAWWAGETGETLEHEVEGEPLAEAVLDTHEDMAGWTLRLALLASVAAAGTTLAARKRPTTPEPWTWRLAVALPAAAAAVFVAWTAHLGGIMVWGVPAGP